MIGRRGPRGRPGLQGDDGDDGDPGDDGAPAFAVTQSSFEMPAVEGATAEIPMSTAAWMTVGLTVYVVGAGVMTIASVTGSDVALVNTGQTGNVAAGEDVPGGAVLFPIAPPGAGGSGGMTYGYTGDMAEEPHTDFIAGGDRDVTIDGVAWTITGTANAALLETTNGTGLRIQKTTAPSVVVLAKTKIITLDPDAEPWQDAIEVWVRFAATVAGASAGNEVAIEIRDEGGLPSANGHQRFRFKRVSTASAAVNTHVTTMQDGGAETTQVNVVSDGDDVVCFRLLSASCWEVYSGLWTNGDWPRPRALNFLGKCDWTNTTAAPSFSSQATNGDMVALQFYVFSSTAAQPSLTIKNIRIGRK